MTQVARAGLEFAQQIAVVAFGLGLVAPDIDQQRREAVDRGEDQRDMSGLGRRAVAQAADQIFGRMGEAADARQREKAAAALDRVDVPEKTGDQRRVGMALLEMQQLHRRRVDVLGRFEKKFFEQIVHATPRAADAALAGSWPRRVKRSEIPLRGFVFSPSGDGALSRFL